MIKVLLIDDHEMVRLGVSTYLSIQDDIEVIAEAVNGRDGYEKALHHRPDVILMDLVMDEMDGIEATKRILSDWADAKIIIVTSFIDDAKVYPALEAGAMSYILKTSSAQEIAQAIRQTHIGQHVIEKRVQDKLDEQPTQLHTELTSRELEVLQLIAQGYTNQDIADTLFITIKTVKTHVSNILSKLGVSDRTQATIYAFQHQLVQQGE